MAIELTGIGRVKSVEWGDALGVENNGMRLLSKSRGGP